MAGIRAAAGECDSYDLAGFFSATASPRLVQVAVAGLLSRWWQIGQWRAVEQAPHPPGHLRVEQAPQPPGHLRGTPLATVPRSATLPPSATHVLLATRECFERQPWSKRSSHRLAADRCRMRQPTDGCARTRAVLCGQSPHRNKSTLESKCTTQLTACKCNSTFYSSNKTAQTQADQAPAPKYAFSRACSSEEMPLTPALVFKRCKRLLEGKF